MQELCDLLVTSRYSLKNLECQAWDLVQEVKKVPRSDDRDLCIASSHQSLGVGEVADGLHLAEHLSSARQAGRNPLPQNLQLSFAHQYNLVGGIALGHQGGAGRNLDEVDSAGDGRQVLAGAAVEEGKRGKPLDLAVGPVSKCQEPFIPLSA